MYVYTTVTPVVLYTVRAHLHHIVLSACRVDLLIIVGARKGGLLLFESVVLLR